MRKGKLAGDVEGTTDGKNRTVGQGERWARQRLEGEKRAERRKIALLEEHAGATRVSNERRGGGG